MYDPDNDFSHGKCFYHDVPFNIEFQKPKYRDSAPLIFDATIQEYLRHNNKFNRAGSNMIVITQNGKQDWKRCRYGDKRIQCHSGIEGESQSTCLVHWKDKEVKVCTVRKPEQNLEKRRVRLQAFRSHDSCIRVDHPSGSSSIKRLGCKYCCKTNGSGNQTRYLTLEGRKQYFLTKFFCMTCRVGLCLECWDRYHKDPTLPSNFCIAPIEEKHIGKKRKRDGGGSSRPTVPRPVIRTRVASGGVNYSDIDECVNHDDEEESRTAEVNHDTGPEGDTPNVSHIDPPINVPTIPATIDPANQVTVSPTKSN